MSETLKPCPFCGQTVKIQKLQSECLYLYEIRCVSGCIMYRRSIEAENIFEARLMWNTRADTKIIEDQVILRDAIGRIMDLEYSIGSVREIRPNLNDRLTALEAKTENIPDPS